METHLAQKMTPPWIFCLPGKCRMWLEARHLNSDKPSSEGNRLSHIGDDYKIYLTQTQCVILLFNDK